MSYASTPTLIFPPSLSIIPTKFEVDMTIHCGAILLICHVTLWPWPLNFWPWTVVIHGGSRDQPLPPSLKTLCLSVLELWVITFPVGCHWKCVHGHYACAEPRDPCVGGQKQLQFWNARLRFAYSLYNFYWATTTIKGRLLSSVTNAKALNCVNFVCVTLTFHRLTLNSCHTWRVTLRTLPPSLKLSMVPIDYHWKCIRGHCTCAESCDL